jgi:DNA-binding response OmpR family regulator
VPNSALMFNFRAARVATLEENVFASKITRAMLSGFGFQHIAVYRSADEAAKKLLAAPVDILLCDPFPAYQKTFDFLTLLRTPAYGEVSLSPIIIMTAKVSIDMLKAAKQCQIDYVIAKPFSPRVLLDRIIWSASKGDRRNALTLPDSLTTSAGNGDVELW